MKNAKILSPSEILISYPFTNPVNSFEDIAVLEKIAKRIREILVDAPPKTISFNAFVYNFAQNDGRRYRIVIYDYEGIRANSDITFVGFFSKKQRRLSQKIIDDIARMDKELVRDLAGTPGLLSYSSIELPDNNWCNLVLFRNPQGKYHVKTNEGHMYAAFQLGPQYYRWIRLSTGIVPGGLFSNNKLLLEKTNYYDFKKTKMWFATRPFT